MRRSVSFPFLSSTVLMSFVAASQACSDGAISIGSSATAQAGPPGDAGAGDAASTYDAISAANLTPPEIDPFPEHDSGTPPVWPACSAGDVTARVNAWIAFDSNQDDGNRDLYLVRPDGSGLTRLTSDPARDAEPAPSPDGKVIAFTSDRDGISQIYLLSMADRSVTLLTHRQEGADQPSFSNDGTSIAFRSGASAYIIGLDGTGERVGAAPLPSFNGDSYPRFISHDTELVYDSNNQVSAASLRTGQVRTVVGNATLFIKAPSVAPSGDEIVYAAQCNWSFGLWTAPATLSTPACGGRLLTPLGDTESTHPSWGPEGVFAYERSRGYAKNPGALTPDPGNPARIAVLSRAPGSTPCLLGSETADNRDPSWVTASGVQP